jgi:hypothetical protein
MIKSPISLLFAAAGIILAFSPDARKAVRKMAVKGTEWILDLNEQFKAGARDEHLANVSSGNDAIRTTNVGILESEQPHIAH